MKGTVWVLAGLPCLVALGLASCGPAVSLEPRGGREAAAIDRQEPLQSPQDGGGAPPPQPDTPKERAASLRSLETLRGTATDKQKLRAAKHLGVMAAKGSHTALDGLLQVLADKEGGRRRVFAAIGLRESKRAEAVEPLIEIMQDPGLPAELRMHAAETLGTIGDNRAIPALLQAVDDPGSADVRYYAYVALYLKPFQSQVAQTPLLLKILKDREQSQFRRARAALFLSRMGDETAVAPLIELLREEPRSPEMTVADPTKGEAQMYAAIMTQQRNVRAKIALALGSLADARAVKPLLQGLNQAGDDSHFSETSQRALERIEKQAGLAPFLAALKDTDPSVRQQTVLFLARLGGPEAEGLLQGALNDDNPGVREQAAAALSNLRERRSTPPVVPAEEESDATTGPTK